MKKERLLQERCVALFNDLELTKKDLSDISVVYSQHPIFSKVIDKIIANKSKEIIEICSTQQELDLARLTLDGNEEIKEVFKIADLEYKKQNEKKSFDKHAII